MPRPTILGFVASRRRFNFGIADSIRSVREVVTGLTGEAKEGFDEVREGIRKRRVFR